MPKAKIKTLTLSKDPSEHDYLVEKITDSIAYTPGTYIPPVTVELLCDDEEWKVITVKFKG